MKWGKKGNQDRNINEEVYEFGDNVELTSKDGKDTENISLKIIILRNCSEKLFRNYFAGERKFSLVNYGPI